MDSSSQKIITLSEWKRSNPSLFQVAKEDPRQIIESTFRIVDINAEVVPFKFNEPQNLYYENRSPRDEILKARKEGFSSAILGMFAVRFLYISNIWLACISHETEATKKLLSKVKFYLENMYTPDGWKIDVSNDIIFTRNNIEYPSEGDKFYIGTAGSKAFGRGDTLHYLHCSEHAFWEYGATVFTGLANAVPDVLERTQIVKESTANGSGNWHHRNWQEIIKGDSAYKGHFFGWNQDSKNTKDPGINFKATDEEIDLSYDYNLSTRQLAWRRWKISAMTADYQRNHTKEDKFRQEYPITDKEAFISSGKAFFDEKMLTYHKETKVKLPLKKMELFGWDQIIARENSNYPLSVWAEPDPEDLYAIGADVASGGDFSYASVFSKLRNEQVAEFNMQLDEYEFANLLFRLGSWYNDALVGVEENDMGIFVIRKLDELGYSNQYRKKTLNGAKVKTSKKLGWKTTESTRPIMLSNLSERLSLNKVVIRSGLFYDQAEAFKRNKKGRAEAISGMNDDSVMGNAIAQIIIEDVPMPQTIEFDRQSGYTPNSTLNKINKDNKWDNQLTNQAWTKLWQK